MPSCGVSTGEVRIGRKPVPSSCEPHQTSTCSRQALHEKAASSDDVRKAELRSAAQATAALAQRLATRGGGAGGPCEREQLLPASYVADAQVKMLFIALLWLCNAFCPCSMAPVHLDGV
jgi:hypothetical protein